MKNTRPILAAAVLLAFPLSAPASLITTDNFTGFTMDFVTVTGGTTADNTGYGAVSGDYRMGQHEVSGAMIDAYNTNGGGPAITRELSFSASQPATSISWNEAARFVNWLNTSEGYSAAYNFTTGGANDPITLWTSGDAGYDAANPFRNSDAFYFLPSEDEWYRAAYYDPEGGVYWDYATGSDSAPTAVSGGTAAGTAVYNFKPGPAEVTNAGGLSPFGTMGQNGNAWEWAESAVDGLNDTAGESRVIRGGNWVNNFASGALQSSNRGSGSPTLEGVSSGFRVASVSEATAVPEASEMALALVGFLGLLTRRRRR